MKFGFNRFMLMNSLLDDGGTGGGAGAPAGTPPADDKGGAGNPPPKADDKGNPPPAKNDPNDESWRNSLPDDLKNDPTIKNIKNVEAGFRMLLNAQKLIGKDKVVIPDASADDKQWNEVMKKLGLPETVDKYEFKAPEGTDKDFLKDFKEFGHSNGLLPRHAEKLMGWFKERADKIVADNEEAGQKHYNEALDGLKKEWGQAFDRKLSNASGMFKQFADETTRKELREIGFSNNPTVVKLMAKISEAFGEGKFIAPGGNGTMGLSPDEADRKIKEVYSKYPNHPYFDKKNAGHEQARKDMAAWNEAKLAGKK